MIRIGHCADSIHHIADGRPILAVGCHIIVGTLSKDIGADIDPFFVENIRSIHQKALDRLGFCLAVSIVEIDGPRLFILLGQVGEADIIKLDLMEAHQLHRLHRQIHLVLPDGSVKGRRPVLTVQFEGISLCVGDGILRMVLHKIGVVKGGDPTDHIVACILQFLDGCTVLFHGIACRSRTGGAIVFHHLGSVSDGSAVCNIHNKGIDTAVICDL